MAKSAQLKTVDHGSIKSKGKTNELENWITTLVTQQKELQQIVPSKTKSERIEKRLAKKRRLEDSKQQQLPNKNKKIEPLYSLEPGAAGKLRNKKNSLSDTKLHLDRKHSIRSTNQNGKSNFRLNNLSERIAEAVSRIKENRKTWVKKYEPALDISRNISQRRRQKQSKNSEDWMQPHRSNYGGIGLARPSLFIPLDDPSWQPKLEEEFSQHIPGFYGKQRTKAMKKQLDGQMLWRQLQKQKSATGKSLLSSDTGSQQIKIGGKLISQMNPDERINAMLRAGYK